MQTVAALGLKESDNWQINFDTGVMTRALPSPPAA
jgi:hypothetical protein